MLLQHCPPGGWDGWNDEMRGDSVNMMAVMAAGGERKARDAEENVL